MSFKAKYIIVEVEELPYPVVFSELIKHSDMSKITIRAVFNGEGKVIGAGFVYVDERGRYVCYGESTSLDVKSRGVEDSDILNKFLCGNN